MQNAFFKVSIRDNGTFIMLYPSFGGGNELSLSEVTQYMKRACIPPFESEESSAEFIDAIEHLFESVEIRISELPIKHVDEMMAATVSNDRMTAFARFYAPSEDGTLLSKDDILNQLNASGVLAGILEDDIEHWLQNRSYCTDIQVAKAIPPQESRDAVIEYMFEQHDVFRASIREDGSVDFHQLNLLNDVAKGDVLAVLTPAHQGKNGVNVIGKELPSRNPLKKALRHGRNVELSEDGCVLTASSGGYVEMEGEKVILHNTYTVKGNVGTATGDVDFDGIVKISGDVLSGYSVKASIDILVQGVVEGASLHAGRNIVIGSGVHGNARAHITAGEDVTANFIQESVVNAGGSVYSGSILYSKITARDSIIVSSGKGLVKGGELHAKALISVKTVGSPRTGANALLTVGTDPDELAALAKAEALLAKRRSEYAELQQSLIFLSRKIEKNEILHAKHKKLAKHLPEHLSTAKEDIALLSERIEKMKARIVKSNTGKVVVEGTIYDGAEVIISNTVLHLHEDLAQCQFSKKGAEIEVSSI